MNKYFLYIFATVIFQLNTIDVSAQKDTLPDFSVLNVGGVIHISWHNPFKNTIQINIQRSKESNKNFITIHSTPDASARFYRYTDKTAPNDSCYYRVFILYESSNYQFSKVIRPVKSDQLPEAKHFLAQKEKEAAKKDIQIPDKPSVPEKNNQTAESSSIKQKEVSTPKSTPIRSDPNRKEIPLTLQKHEFAFRLAISRKAIIKNIKPVPIIQTQKVWKSSPLIYTGNDGNVLIQIPDAPSKKYSVTFLKEEGRPLFKIQHIKKSSLTIDKSSFLKSGWYYFELRESNKVIERNKFLVTKDF